jgi:hypothetical protein
LVTIAEIKEKLLTWPDEVVGEWLLYFADDVGWPPPEPFGDHRCGRLLGNRPLSRWSEVTWKREDVDCAFEKMSGSTKRRVSQIITEIAKRTADEVTSRRYKHPFKYIMENGTFPNPMVAMRAGDGLSLIDGHHRMAAFTDLQKLPDGALEKRDWKKPLPTQSIWIGTHACGELPAA